MATPPKIGNIGVIADGFIFYNELDILAIRLEEVYPVVDRIVLVESSKTFRGNPKPFYFEENKERYAQYLDKITHIKLHDDNMHFSSDPKVEPWDREHWQRSQIAEGFAGMQPEDIVIIGDVDEIPRREIIPTLAPETTVRLVCKMYYYSLNAYAGGCGALKAARFSSFTTPGNLRHSDPPVEIPNAGWHFSYLGDPAHIENKFKSFSHWELDIPDLTSQDQIARRMQNGVDLWGRGDKYEFQVVDDTWPHAVCNDLVYYKKYIRGVI
jgi:beta-1,4-mannosyl-glycoprotein beta-1,4-N-acetylglucosaminyltransferase